MQDLKQLVQSIDSKAPRFLHKLIGVDGLGASGKTTIVKKIQELHPRTSIIHTDEFYLPEKERGKFAPSAEGISQDFDWERLYRQVINPVEKNLLVKYESYDWRNDKWNSWIEIPEHNWIVIVGVYALQDRFFNSYNYTIWADTDREERIRRMTEREGEEVSKEWQKKWLPMEEHYFEISRPERKANSILRD